MELKHPFYVLKQMAISILKQAVIFPVKFRHPKMMNIGMTVMTALIFISGITIPI